MLKLIQIKPVYWTIVKYMTKLPKYPFRYVFGKYLEKPQTTGNSR